MSDDFTRELRAALSDLERHAPKPPALATIRQGGPAILTYRRPRRWSPAATLAAAAAVTVVVVGIAVFVGSRAGSDTALTAGETGSIEGIWLVESFTVDGSTTPVDVAAFEAADARRPFIEITGERLTGWTGCNSLEGQGPVAFDGQTLAAGEVFVTAAGCDLDQAESPLLAVLWSEAPVSVELSESSMTLSSETTSVRFIRSETEPLRSPPTWQTSSELIDCSPFPILGQSVPAEEQDARPVLAAFPGVVTVEGSGLLGGDSPWAYGLDASGTVIAVAAPGDIMPPIIHLSACGDSYGLRSDYVPDLQGQAMTWVNMTGLAQFRTDVWDARFIELCSSTEADIADLAVRYMAQDVDFSVRVDGDLPTDPEATEALTVIWRSTCQAGLDSLAPTTTQAPPTTAATDTTCSTTGFEVEDAPDAGANPLPVENARERLIALALACDFEGLVDFANEGSGERFDDAIFWGAAQSVETLREHDAMYESLRLLATALATVPRGVYDGERIDSDTGDTVPERYYQWPPRADIPDGGSLTDVWDPELLQAVAELNNATVAELVEAADLIGGYGWFRVGITENGRWLFALTGD